MSGIEELLTGRTLGGRYRIEEVIGRGGFAAVYRATDERLGRQVAVKVITLTAPDQRTRDEIQQRFEREARAIANLNHPNVVTLYDFGTDPELGLDFFVMELLEGEDLAQRIARGPPLPLGAALGIVEEAAWGVNAGHRAGLIHRDIKPGNVFLAAGERRGAVRVCVLDFGVARFVQSEEGADLTGGGGGPLSPTYAAPEQLRGDADIITPATDVFGLGVIAYELLAGARAYSGERLRSGDGAEDLPPLGERNPAVPAEVAAVVHRALAQEPSERYATAGEFGSALSDATAPVEADAELAGALPPAVPRPPRGAADPAPDQPTLSYRPGSATEALRPRPRRRRRLPTMAALLLLGVAVAAVAWWVLGRDGGNEPVAAVGEDTPTQEQTGGGPQPATSPPATTEPTATADAEQPPSGSAARLNREGEALFARGDQRAAAARFRRAVEASPNSAHFRNNYGWALLQSGDVAGAERELTETIRLDPRRAIAYANLGEVRLAQGDRTAAAAAYERFLELNDDPRRERIAREKLRRIRGG